MATDLRCPACGASNALTQMFCRSCGAKLSLSGIQAKDLKGRGTVSIRLGGILRGAVSIALVIVLVLLVWPQASAGVRGGSKDAAAMANTIGALQRAQQLSEHHEVVFSESELNAYLDKMIDDSNESAGAGSRPALKEIRCALRDGTVAMTVTAQWGPLPVSLEVEARPEWQDGPLDFVVTRGRFGHLPLPGLGARLVRRRIEKVFAQAAEQRGLMHSLTLCRLSYGRARVAVGTGP